MKRELENDRALREHAARSDKGRNSQLTAVDLFCGIGGLTHGLELGGLDVAAGVDIDPACEYAYEANNRARFVLRSVADLTAREVGAMLGNTRVRVLAGCAPCQPFSTYSQSARRVRADNRWSLVHEFGRLVRTVKPELVTMENVPALATTEVFRSLLRELRGYHVWYDVVDCARIGIPQTRRRLVLLASRLGPLALKSSATQSTSTVREAIGHLPALAAGESDAADFLHRASRLSFKNLERIRASSPGGTWRDWPRTLRARCHKKDSGSTYPAVYGRMEWDAPAPTITTQCFGYGNGRFGHPMQDRAISLREAAILQTFPVSYRFTRPGEEPSFASVGRLIGNAVPVRLGQLVGETLVQHVAEHV